MSDVAIISKSIHRQLDQLENVMRECQEVECPLEHLFTTGLYTRVIVMGTGDLIVSKIHKTDHPFFILKGSVHVKIGDGEWVRLEAPYMGVTKAGTRRVLYIEEDCIWITSHVLVKEGETLEEIEERIIEKRIHED